MNAIELRELRDELAPADAIFEFARRLRVFTDRGIAQLEDSWRGF